jgi:type IX secretion system PorP/SprF family membrane protein
MDFSNKTGLKSGSFSIFLFWGVFCAYSQIDFPVHFTDAPLRINPARAGLSDNFAPEGKGSVYASYKNQTSDMFGGSSLKIIDAGVEQSFMNKSISIGFDVFSGTLCKTALTDFSFRFTAAYHWNISKDFYGNVAHRISFGLQAAYRNFSLNTDNLTTVGMYNPTYTGGIDWSSSPFANGNYNSTRNIFDMAAGVYYTGETANLLCLHVGVSANHITRPKTAFIEENSRTPVRTIVQADITWQSTDFVQSYNNRGKSIQEIPSGMMFASGDILYSNQGAFNAIEVGGSFRYYIKGRNAVGAMLHGRYENKNGEIIPALSFHFSVFSLYLGYEVFFKNSLTNMAYIGLKLSW